jgi:hypothetical protein
VGFVEAIEEVLFMMMIFFKWLLMIFFLMVVGVPKNVSDLKISLITKIEK